MIYMYIHLDAICFNIDELYVMISIKRVSTAHSLHLVRMDRQTLVFSQRFVTWKGCQSGWMLLGINILDNGWFASTEQ